MSYKYLVVKVTRGVYEPNAEEIVLDTKCLDMAMEERDFLVAQTPDEDETWYNVEVMRA